MQKPSIGRIVHYTLSEYDAAQINRRRDDARGIGTAGKTLAEESTGAVIHAGNQAHEGDVYPLVITRVWGDTPTSAVNGQVLLDGNDTLWVTSRSVGDGPGNFAWPARV